MPAYISPGVYVIEKDWSDYTPSLNSTDVGVIGFASQGPVGKATLVTNQDQLINIFGRPDDAAGGFGLIGAYHILERTNTLYFTRVATASASVADTAVQVGACPYGAVTNLSPDAYHLFLVSVSGSDGVTKTEYPLIFNVPPASANSSFSGAADAIAAAVNSTTTPTSPVSFEMGNDASSGAFVGTYAGSGAAVEIYAWSSTTDFGVIPNGTTKDTITSFSSQNSVLQNSSGNVGIAPSLGYNGTSTVASGVVCSGSVFDPADLSGGAFVVKSLYPGAGYNYSSTIETYGPKVTGLQIAVESKQGPRCSVTLLKGGGVEETHEVELFTNATGIDLSPENVINNTADESNKTSDYIIGEFSVDTASNPDILWTLPTTWGGSPVGNGTSTATIVAADGSTVQASLTGIDFIKFVEGVYNFEGGVNGDLGDGNKSFSDDDVKAAIIGNGADGDGIYSFLKEDVNISLLAIPGCTEQNIVNNAIAIAENSQEFLFVTNPPLGISSPQTAIAWSNGQAEGRTTALNSSYACVYWPWVKLFNPFTQVDEYVSPDIFAIRQMAFTDSTFDAWFPPAGMVRGRLNKPVDVEVVLTPGDRDALYGPGNVINPVQKFSTEGIVLWGQKTTQRTATALDRINVRRLMIIIRKMILASTRQFVFEPNDAATWKRVVTSIEPMMADIKSRRGITDFRVICDSTTNTPARIDRNELWCKVLLQPTKAAEVIVFELNLTSASLGLNIPTV